MLLKSIERMVSSDARHGHVENLIDGKIDYSVIETFLDAGLIDLFANQRDTDPQHGKRRIDYIFASPDLAANLVDAAWHTEPKFDEMSDHPPTSATLAVPVATRSKAESAPSDRL